MTNFWIGKEEEGETFQIKKVVKQKKVEKKKLTLA